MMNRWAALSVVVMMALTACSSSDDPKADPKPVTLKLPEPGQCIAEETKDLDSVAPDYTSVVNCGKSHVYEIVDVLKVPKKFLVSGSREERLDRRNELAKLTASGALADDFHSYADRGCRGSVLRATGLADVLIDQASAFEAEVRPVLIGARISTRVGPADQWAAGKPTIICSVRYTDPRAPEGPEGKDAPIRSTSSVPTYRALLTKDFPAERRACGSYNSDNYMYAVLCTNQHNTEALFSYDADAAFDRNVVASIDPAEITDAEWDLLVTPCADSLQTVIGTDIDEELVASVYLADDWDSSHLATCLITPLDDKLDLPPGSVVGQAGVVNEVPARKGARLGPYAKGA